MLTGLLSSMAFNTYPSPVYQVLNVNWSAFLNDILLTLQSHSWNNGTHGVRQLDSGDLYLLSLAVWPTVALLATVWASWLLIKCHWGWFMPPLSPPTPPRPTPPRLASHPTPPPIPPPLLSILMAERDGKNYLEIQPSETEKVSYNKNQ